MKGPKFVEIDGKRYIWREMLRLRREQLQAVAKAEQAVLFELKHDERPAADRTSAGRYLEPSLFERLHNE